ncbi:MAG: hypothetical protein ACI9JZ_001314 [Lentimonas sp.]|jgi:hypothetical protein
MMECKPRIKRELDVPDATRQSDLFYHNSGATSTATFGVIVILALYANGAEHTHHNFSFEASALFNGQLIRSCDSHWWLVEQLLELWHVHPRKFQQLARVPSKLLVARYLEFC